MKAEKKAPYPISENQYDADSSSPLVPRRSLEEEAPAGQQPEFDTSERAADSVSENGNVTDGAANLFDTTLADGDGDVKDGEEAQNSEASIKKAPYPISENQYDADSSSTFLPRHAPEEEARSGQLPALDTSDDAADSASDKGSVTDGDTDLFEMT